MTGPAAVFEHVTKDYKTGALGLGRRRAVTDVSLTVPAGQVYGLLLTLCRPTSGSVQRLGAPVSDRRTLGRVGYVHENHAFPRYLTPAALLEYYGALSLVPFEQVKQRVPVLLERVGLSDRANDPIRTFSKGMTQRLGIAQALINDPDLLVLDEPNEGLDLAGRELMLGIIREQRERGRTVILVSHVLPEVEQVCDRIAVLVAGRLVFEGPVADLTRGSDGAVRPFDRALADLYGAPAA